MPVLPWFCSRTRLVAAVLAAALGLAACGGGSTSSMPRMPAPRGPSPTGTLEQSGTISLPAGSTIAPASLHVANSVGTVPVTSNGTFVLPAFSNNPQFTMVKGAAGQPLLLGFLGATQPTIDARSTARVLLYFSAYIFALPESGRDDAIASLDSAPGLAGVQQAIERAIVAHPGEDVLADPAVTGAVNALLAAAAGSSAMPSPMAAGLAHVRSLAAGRRLEDISVNPSNGASGITVVPETPDGIHFENRYRRLAKAFVDEVSHVPAGGTTAVMDRAPDTSGSPIDVTSVSGLNGLFGTIGDILGGTYAYAPTESASVPLPNVAGASSTLYRVAIVGPGALAGAPLLPAEQDTLTVTSVQFMFLDLVLPFVTSIVLPLTANSLDTATANGQITDAFKDALALLQDDPNFVQLAADGDVKGVLSRSITLVASSGKLQDAVFAGISATFASAFPAGVAPGQVLSEGFSHIGTLGDLALTAVDKALVIADLARSDRSDVYMITVIPTRLSIAPAMSITNNFGLVSLTTTVVNGSEVAGDDTLTYAYTNTAKFGHTTDGVNGHQDTFTSNDANIVYDAAATGAGTDTIAVTVSDFNSASHTTTMLGTATATVTVGPQRLAVTPATQTIPQSGTSSLAAALTNTAQLPAGTITYKWTDNAQVGHIKDPVSGTLDAFTTTATTVPYSATTNGVGTDTITVQALLTVGSQPPEVVASATATVGVIAETLALTASPAAIANTATSTLTVTATSSGKPPDGTIAYAWTNTAASGHITDPDNAAIRDAFTTSMTNVIYTPNAGAAGSDTITVQAILTNGTTTQILGTKSSTITVAPGSSNFTASWGAFAPQAGVVYNGQQAGPGMVTATDAGLTFSAHTYVFNADAILGSIGQVADIVTSGTVTPSQIALIYQNPPDPFTGDGPQTGIEFMQPFPTLTTTNEPPYCSASCTTVSSGAQFNDFNLPDQATSVSLAAQLTKWIRNNPHCSGNQAVGCGRGRQIRSSARRRI